MKRLIRGGGILSMAALLGCISGESSNTSGAQVVSSTGSANLDEVLDRIPAADREVMLAQSPLTQAANTIWKVVDTGDDKGYAGIELAHDHVVLWWHGEPSESLNAVIDEARAVAPVEIRPAPHSRREIMAAASKLIDFMRA